MTAPDAPRRTRVQALAVLAATFLVGIVLGVTGERMRTSRPDPSPSWGQGPPPRREGPRDLGRLPRPLEELGLTEDQRRQIRDVFRDTQPLTDDVMARMLPELRAIRDSARVAIETVLTPEQRERLETEFADFWARGPFPGDRFRTGPGGRAVGREDGRTVGR